MSTANKRLVADAATIHDTIQRMARELMARSEDAPWAVVGIQRGGDHLGRRLAKLIEAQVKREVPIGTVDITLYRDDGFGPHDWPEIGQTRIPFRLREYTIVLVDDVLYTGRTVRAALDALVDFGRPKALRLAVLVDRGLRELPIRGDVVGLTLQTTAAQHVDVHLTAEESAEDAIYVADRISSSES